MTTPHDAPIEARWTACLLRFADLLPFFASLRLKVSETQVARAMGLPNADTLRRLLRKRGLPPFRLLRDWYYVVVMVERAESGNAVAKWSMHDGSYPDVYYRFAQHLTGMLWSMTVKHGSQGAKERALAAWAPHMDSRTD